jgi:hypothetical protein
MPRLDDGDAVREQAVLVARHDEAVELGAGRPALLDRKRHRGSGFTGTHDQRAAFGRPRQMLRYELQRISRVQRGVEAAEQKIPRRHQCRRATRERVNGRGDERANVI